MYLIKLNLKLNVSTNVRDNNEAGFKLSMFIKATLNLQGRLKGLVDLERAPYNSKFHVNG
jgi:hypothetical protein